MLRLHGQDSQFGWCFFNGRLGVQIGDDFGFRIRVNRDVLNCQWYELQSGVSQGYEIMYYSTIFSIIIFKCCVLGCP